jgi:hypothetical protein
MTEEEWRTSTEPEAMFTQLGRLKMRAARPWRLFACACCRRIWERIPPKSRKAVEVAEAFAEGKATDAERARAMLAAGLSHHPAAAAARQTATPTRYIVADTRSARDSAARAVAQMFRRNDEYLQAFVAECAAQAELVREVFGNPFRQVAVDPAWLAAGGRAVSRLAEAILEERAFERMPVLGDALEEAGCADAEMLAHCRGPGPHVLGCWLLDWVLGRR